MMLFVYGLLTFLALIAALPFALAMAAASERWRKGFGQRLGFAPRSARRDRVLIHLASVGEAISGQPFVRAVAERLGPDRVVISTMTPTGNAEAARRFPDLAVVFFPADAGPIPAVWLERLGIRRVVLFETELWPVFLLTCRAKGIPAGIVNARISDRSFPRYKLVSFITKPLLSRMKFIAAQTEEYKARLAALGAAPEKIVVTGNLKFETGQPKPLSGELAELIAGFSRLRRILIFASTHEGEEDIALSCLERLAGKYPDVAALIAPRHKERFSIVWQKAAARFPDAIRRSKWKPGRETGGRVLVLDSLGELSSCFVSGYAAFLGGSLAPVGGHNVLEPAAHGLPVAVGPHTQNFRAEALLLESAGGLARVKDGAGLEQILDRWLADPAEAGRIGETARRVVEENQGALAQTLDLLASNGFLE